MNYSQLSTLIQEYCESTESSFVANIPTFVQLAEERIYNTVQIPAIRKNSTATMSIGNKYMSLPTDWLSTFSLAVFNPSNNEYTYLLNKDVNYIRQAYPDADDLGRPEYYAIWDANTMILGPAPDIAYTAELHYYYYPASIVSAGTSWLGDNFETVLLYGSLREAYTYLKGEQDMMNYYEQKYQEALGQLKRLGDGLDRQDAYRSGQVRVQVT
ncbi:MAG: hypothetical protein EB010_14535 [Acidimicrobiia bacterium]|nr:hypothetical protein [Acidimicrobiia bacterium]